ncbi:beta strand repeat-containing protein, partial [Campylobacter hepaticus]
VKNGSDGSRTIFVSATTDENINIRKILNKGIIAGSLNIQNRQDINNGSIHVGDIDNQGYIRDVYIGIWKENHATLTLDSFKNSGLIYNTSDNGILFEGKDVKIGKFINTGIIVGNHTNNSNNASVLIGRPDKNYGNTTINLFLNQGLIGSNMAQYGVKFDSGNDDNGNQNRHKATVKHFINTATIQAKDTALHLSNTTITDFLNMDTIKAENGKAIDTLKQTNITNFINAGTIQGGSSQEAIKFAHSNIDNILNTKTIEGKKQAIVFTGSNIKNFINSGTIKSTNGNNNAIEVMNSGDKTTITHFFNTGAIEAKNKGVLLNNSTLTNFINTGTIKSDNDRAVEAYNNDTQIQNFINKGTLQADNSAVVLFRKTTLTNFINTGMISGKVGTSIHTSTLINFINTGTIKATHDKVGAVLLTVLSGSPITLENFINTGTLDATAHGIIVEAGVSITNLYNNGTIKAQRNGIVFYADNGSGDQGKIDNIIIGKQGSIEANKNAINIDIIGNDPNLKSLSVGLIDIQAGAKVSGQEAGIKIASGNSSNTKTVGQIIVAGEVSGKEGGIVNEGTIKASENKSSSENGNKRSRRSLEESQQNEEESKAAILIKESGQITSTSGYGIVNKALIDGSIISKSSSNISIDNQNGATISGGITNSGSGTLMLNNSGSIGTNDSGYNISNEGSGSVNITSWLIKTDSSTKSLQTLKVGGKSANSVMVENLIVDQSGLNMDELNDINNLVSGVSLNNIKKINTNGSGEMILSYDALSGKISTDFNLNASIIGASFRALNASSIKRNAFIDGLMNNMNLSLTFNPNHFNLNTNLTF